MEHNGFYFAIFRGVMERTIAERHGAAYAKKIMRASKPLYRKLIAEMDDLGHGNPMAYNAQFALAFAAPYLASGGELSPETVQEMMRRSLYHVKFYFAAVNLNTARGKRAHRKSIDEYMRWYDAEKQRRYPGSFLVDEVGKPYPDACYYRITRCPLCAYFKKLGISELLPYLCELDEIMIKLQHGTLRREHTLASGGPYCDYTVLGDHEKPAEKERTP